MIDAQVENPHLVSLGAESWPRTEFLAQVDGLVRQPESLGNWTLRFGLLEARQLAEVNGG